MLMKCLMATGQNLHSSHGTTTSSRCRILTPPKEEGSRANSDYSCHPAVCAPLVPVSEDADMIYIECVQSASRPSQKFVALSSAVPTTQQEKLLSISMDFFNDKKETMFWYRQWCNLTAWEQIWRRGVVWPSPSNSELVPPGFLVHRRPPRSTPEVFVRSLRHVTFGLCQHKPPKCKRLFDICVIPDHPSASLLLGNGDHGRFPTFPGLFLQRNPQHFPLRFSTCFTQPQYRTLHTPCHRGVAVGFVRVATQMSGLVLFWERIWHGSTMPGRFVLVLLLLLSLQLPSSICMEALGHRDCSIDWSYHLLNWSGDSPHFFTNPTNSLGKTNH